MTSRDRSLRQIDDFLKTHPNASVRVKFNGDDNYRNYPSGCVTSDTFCDTTDKGVVFEGDETEFCDTVATLQRHLSFRNGLNSMP